MKKFHQHISFMALWLTCVTMVYACSSEVTDDVPSKEHCQNDMPMISLIDDDTLFPEQVKKFHDICKENDIIATYACIAHRLEAYPGITPLLHEYEDEGFQVTLHCYDQQNYYRWTQNLALQVKNVKSVKVGDVYCYTAKNSKTYSINVEEIHLDDNGNGKIYFNYMKEYYLTPSTNSGIITLVSGKGDITIEYTDFSVSEFRNDEKVIDDMKKAKQIFARENFNDTDYFVSPYGSQDEGLQEIARRMGMKCLVSISNVGILDNSCEYGRYNIPRFGFRTTDSPNHEMSCLKNLIDQTAQNSGWLLVGFHIHDGWTDELLRTRFREFAEYAKAKGLKFVTLKEGFDHYESVFEQHGK